MRYKIGIMIWSILDSSRKHFDFIVTDTFFMIHFYIYIWLEIVRIIFDLDSTGVVCDISNTPKRWIYLMSEDVTVVNYRLNRDLPPVGCIFSGLLTRMHSILSII